MDSNNENQDILSRIAVIENTTQNIKDDINRLFDTRVLPLPEEYITPKNQINYNKYK